MCPTPLQNLCFFENVVFCEVPRGAFHAADLLFWERGRAMGRPKAKQNTHEKTTSEKLFRLTFFSAKNQDEGRKLAPKLSNGLPNNVKMSPGTGFSNFGGHLHFERPYTVLGHISCLRSVKVATEAREILSQNRALKKISQMLARIRFLEKN